MTIHMKGIEQQEAKQNTGPLLTIHEQACLARLFFGYQ